VQDTTDHRQLALDSTHTAPEMVLAEARAPVELARLAGQMEESGVMVAVGPNRYMPIVRGIEVLSNARITGLLSSYLTTVLILTD